MVGLSLSWHGLPELSWCSPNLSSLISHLIKTVSISHGSSLMTRLLGDVGRFLAVSGTPEDSEEWEVQDWSRPILLGDDGRADSWLWQETCEGGLAKRPTVEKRDKDVILRGGSNRLHFVLLLLTQLVLIFISFVNLYFQQVVCMLCFYLHAISNTKNIFWYMLKMCA